MLETNTQTNKVDLNPNRIAELFREAVRREIGPGPKLKDYRPELSNGGQRFEALMLEIDVSGRSPAEILSKGDLKRFNEWNKKFQETVVRLSADALLYTDKHEYRAKEENWGRRKRYNEETVNDVRRVLSPLAKEAPVERIVQLERIGEKAMGTLVEQNIKSVREREAKKGDTTPRPQSKIEAEVARNVGSELDYRFGIASDPEKKGGFFRKLSKLFS